ncbi:MAG: phosphatase PAP2 family protein [bacterium]
MTKYVIICLLFFNTVFSQGFVYNGTQFYNDSKEFIKRPIKWKGKDLIVLSGIAIGTYGLMFIDENVRHEIIKDNTNYKNVYFEFGRYWGEPFTAPIVGTALFIQGSINDNSVNKRIGFEIIQSSTYTALVTGLLKISFGRARPYTNETAACFHPFSLIGDDYYALPSGHSSLAFVLSTTLALNSKNTVGKIVSFIPALLTVTSRIAYNKHWLSDTFLGSAIGFFIAKYAHNLHQKPQQQGIEAFQNPASINISVPLF